MKLPIAAALALFVSACASPEPHKFERADTDKQASQRDHYECERDARMINADGCTQIDLFEQCMQARGYKPIPGTNEPGLCRRIM